MPTRPEMENIAMPTMSNILNNDEIASSTSRVTRLSLVQDVSYI